MIRSAKQQVVNRFPDLVSSYHAFRKAWEMRRYPLRLTLYGFKIMGHESMQAGTFESDEVALVMRRLQRVSAFVDVGSNIGFYACIARQMGIPVIAIEPSAQNLDYLYANLRANGWDDVEVFPVGLADRPGLATLYGGGTGASLIRRWAGTSDIWYRTVPVSTLDTLLCSRFAQEKLLIKIDVEGWEHAVLQGAIQTLSRSPQPTWLVEVCLTEHHPDGINPHFREVFELFWRFGYEAHTVGKTVEAVAPDDVDRFVQNRERDFGSNNYLFEQPAQTAPTTSHTGDESTK